MRLAKLERLVVSAVFDGIDMSVELIYKPGSPRCVVVFPCGLGCISHGAKQASRYSNFMVPSVPLHHSNIFALYICCMYSFQ